MEDSPASFGLSMGGGRLDLARFQYGRKGILREGKCTYTVYSGALGRWRPRGRTGNHERKMRMLDSLPGWSPDCSEGKNRGWI